MKKPKTWHEMARVVYGNISDEECERVLWESTCFPFGRPSRVFRQLREGFAVDGTVSSAVAKTYEDMDRLMDELR